MSININSEASCRQAYLNYHCYGNTMGITAREMGQITNKWADRLDSWQQTVADDENQYEFDDSEFETHRQDAFDDTKDKVGGGSSTTDTWRGVGDGLFAAGGAITDAAVNIKTSKTGSKMVEGKSVSNGEKDISFIISCTQSAATATMYLVNKPNEENKKACDQLQTELTGAQGVLTGAQADMQDANAEVVSLSDEANEYNEETNEEILDKKAEYDMYMKSFVELKTKIENGETLTEEEKELYKYCCEFLTATGEDIDELADENSGVIEDLHDDMADYQDRYDYAAETVAEAQGMTDYAASIDSATRDSCYVNAVAQGLNALSGGQGAAKAAKFAAAGGWTTAWAWAFVALGGFGAVTSGIGTKEQIDWAGQVGNEIDIRKATQDLEVETQDAYTENIDIYDGWMSGVEELEVEIPEDIAPPEDAPEVPTETEGKDDGEDKVDPNKKPEDDKNKK